MAVLSEIRRRARHIAPQAVAACAALYFVYHAVQGERGVLAWVRLQNDLAVVEAKREALAEERKELEHRVELLRPDSLDPDLLEERARATLNYTRPDEVVIPLESGGQGAN
jgi:cell division protein FtsB